MRLPAGSALLFFCFDILREIPTIPGTDDTLEEVMSPSSTWGVYSVDLAGDLARRSAT